MKQKGIVKWYDNEKGYGFIIPDGGGDDVFLHCSNLPSGRKVDEIEEGQPVEFTVFKSFKGKEARDVLLIGGGSMFSHKKTWGPGYRIFKCQFCSARWIEVSNNCTDDSPSVCKKCDELQYPVGYEKRFEWETDEMGNLTEDHSSDIGDLSHEQ
jgi:CspA family cold shock protein